MTVDKIIRRSKGTRERIAAEQAKPPAERAGAARDWRPPTMRGLELRYIRHELGLTQSKFGEQMGVYGRTIRKWENSEREIPGPAIVLARLLLEKFTKK